jgi:membrane dipeptidase
MESESLTKTERAGFSRIFIDGLMGGVLTPRVIARLRGSGVTAINLTAVRIGGNRRECMQDIISVREIIDQNEESLLLVKTADDIRRAKATGRVGIIVGLQDTESLGRDIYFLRVLRELGVRVIQITHNRQCNIGTGCVEPDSGLTDFGRQTVKEMNRLGMIVDLSHCGHKTTMDAIRYSAFPVLCTHSNPQALCPSVRNKSDEIIEELAARNGAIGVAAWSPIVYRGARVRPTLSDVTDCIHHVVRLVGPEHVGIGTDLCDDLTASVEAWNQVYGPEGNFPQVSRGLGDWYNYETNMAEGLDTIADMPNLIATVSKLDYPNSTIDKIFGLNFLRVFEEVTESGIN